MSLPIDVLLVEDNEDHVFLIRRALQEVAADSYRLRVAATGTEALDLVHNASHDVKKDRPDLILLDINLPDMSGLDVLRELKKDGIAQIIPVLMLTTSDADPDIVTAYRLGAASYITKPVSATAFQERVQGIPAYWNRISQTPPRVG